MTMLERQKEKTMKLAVEKGISEEQLNRMYQEKIQSFPDTVSETQKALRAFKLVRGELNSDRKEYDTLKGMLLCRFRDNTYNKYMYDKVQEYIDKNGLEAAQDAQMVNTNGDYLFTTGFNKGEVIDPKNIRGSAVGIFQNEDGEPEARFVKIGKFQIDKKIPLGSEIEMKYTEAKSTAPNFNHKDCFYNGAIPLVENQLYTVEELESYSKMIEELVYGKVFENYDDMIEYAENITDDKNNIIGVWCDVLEVGDKTSGNVSMLLEFEGACVKYWCDKNIYNGLTVPAGGSGIVLLNAYKGKDGVGFNIIGFLPYDDE